MKDKLVSSHFKGQPALPHRESHTISKCDSCEVCPFICTDNPFSYQMDLLMCYAILLIVKLQELSICLDVNASVGKTFRPLDKRLQKHLYAIKIGDLTMNLVRHVAKFHKYKQLQFFFTVLDRIHQPICGVIGAT